jgi:hypothetical protein
MRFAMFGRIKTASCGTGAFVGFEREYRGLHCVMLYSRQQQKDWY